MQPMMLTSEPSEAMMPPQHVTAMIWAGPNPISSIFFCSASAVGSSVSSLSPFCMLELKSCSPSRSRANLPEAWEGARKQVIE